VLLVAELSPEALQGGGSQVCACAAAGVAVCTIRAPCWQQQQTTNTLPSHAPRTRAQQDAASPLALPNITQVVAPAPPIDFTVTAAAASPNGHQLLLSGVAQQARVCACAAATLHTRE
jgi:hypothetical protein